MSLAMRKSDRSTRAALERVLRGRVRAGLAEIATHGTEASAHELRKRTKELRGLLHILRPGLKGAKALDRRLRDAARLLSSMRDAEVMLARFDAEVATFPRPEEFAGLRLQVLDTAQSRTSLDRAESIDRYANAFKSLQTDLANLTLKEKAQALLWEGIYSTWARVCAREADARSAFDADLDSEPFHDWRKSVKHHCYQARFLKKIAPKKMAAHIKTIDALAELLGHHNDLDVLWKFLETRTALSEADDLARALLRGRILARRQSLATDALALARKHLNVAPGDLVKDWQARHRRWRKA